MARSVRRYHCWSIKVHFFKFLTLFTLFAHLTHFFFIILSIPTAVSLATATGASPDVFIIGSIWSCLIASIVSSSHYNLLGPTGSTAGIIAKFALDSSIGPMIIPYFTILSGLMILLIPILDLQQYFLLIPSSVIQGFTLGYVSIIHIIIQQI